MGTCSVINSSFFGTVEASGNHAGGIAGGGYSNSTAPNGIRISVNGCTAEAEITGRDKVGGILGGDSFVAQAWNAYEFKNNRFKGTVTATEGIYAGGIIGYYQSLNKMDDIADNWYQCNLANAFGKVKYVDTNCETHETELAERYFSTENGTSGCPKTEGCNWRKNHNRTDDPLGADKDLLCYSDLAYAQTDAEIASVLDRFFKKS